KYDLTAAEPMLCARDHIAAFDLDLGAELRQRKNQEIDRARADGATAGHRDFRLAHARDERRDDPEARPHLGDEFVGRGGVDNGLGRKLHGAPAVRLLAGTLAGDRHVDAVVTENAL